MWFLRFAAYPWMFFHELSLLQYNFVQMMVTSANFFFCKCYRGDATTKILSLEYLVLYGILEALSSYLQFQKDHCSIKVHDCSIRVDEHSNISIVCFQTQAKTHSQKGCSGALGNSHRYAPVMVQSDKPRPIMCDNVILICFYGSFRLWEFIIVINLHPSALK